MKRSNSMKLIEDYTVGETIESTFLIRNVIKGSTTSMNPYLSLTLQDRSGSIEAKLWQVSDEQLEKIVSGIVVKIKGDVTKYRQNLQLKILTIEIMPAGSYDPAHYVESAPFSKQELDEKLTKYLFKIENIKMQQIVRTIFNEWKEDILSYPAASKNHHEYVSGLAYHMVSMLDLADCICNLYPTLNRSLLYAGVFLHDLGKTIELSGPILTEYTVEGKLCGHISILNAKLSQVAKELKFEGEEVFLLQHMVLSHHGKLEFGSPVLPQLKEAEVLCYIDNLDSRIQMLDKALDPIDEGQFTTRVFALENRAFYKPKL